MDGSDQFTAAERAEQLCQEVKSMLAHLANGKEPDLGASIGMACRSACSGEGTDSLIRRADLAMYQVKRNGKGRWLVSQEDPIG
jgi:diguanylate cyclase (GGDEF)-like protein